MKKEYLYNKKDREELKKELLSEPFNRITSSFYRYITIEDPGSLRDELYKAWSALKVLGRIYISKEGINAQFSIPKHNWDIFIDSIESFNELKQIPMKVAIEDGMSFYKLTIKEKDEIVAYNISANEYDMSVIGRHLDPEAFNHKMDQKRSVVVDMRNYYESEVGKFSGAITPNVSKSKELLPEVKNLLKGHEKDPVLLYCTGGIRCEKASSYLIHSGFEDVYQLSGGIIKYAHEVKKKNLSSKFKGKNFVFDARMGERITEDIIGACYQCGAQSDTHLDCNNDACHVLFIQCVACKEEYNGCCSTECKNFSELSLDQQRDFRKDPNKIVSKARYSFRIESINKG